MSLTYFSFDAFLELHNVALHKLNLPISHPRMRVFCRGYADMDSTFFSKFSRATRPNHFLIAMGIANIMNFFFAFLLDQVPHDIFEYMADWERLKDIFARNPNISF